MDGGRLRVGLWLMRTGPAVEVRCDIGAGIVGCDLAESGRFHLGFCDYTACATNVGLSLWGIIVGRCSK